MSEMNSLTGSSRVLVWFSCGAASAVAAKIALEKYKDTNPVEVLYCDTLAYEHPDNYRFLLDIQKWLGIEIKILKSKKYTDIYDVFEKTRWLVGPAGARCTTELKKNVRAAYQCVDDIHVFGFTVDERQRAERLVINQPEIDTDFVLVEAGITKTQCYKLLQQAEIALPAMYLLGYNNNNCIGCVKGQSGYWNKVRKDFPTVFDKMARLERKLNAAINKKYINGKRVRVFLDELDPGAGFLQREPNIECGVICINEAKLLSKRGKISKKVNLAELLFKELS